MRKGDEKAIRDALIEKLRNSGIEVITDSEEGQRVLDAVNGGARMMGSRVSKRMTDISDFYADRELSEQGKTVIDVFTGKKDRASFKFYRTDGSRVIEIQQGNENHSGSKHSIFRHFNTKVGFYTAQEIAFIPDIITNGQRKEEGKSVIYSKTIDDVQYKVITDKKGNKEVFNDFYTNRKAATSESSNTPSGARTSEVTAIHAANVHEKSDTSKSQDVKSQKSVPSEEDIRFFRTSNGDVYGFTKGGKIYIDPDMVNAKTPIHEYAHLWAEDLRMSNPKEWQNVVGLMKDTPLWDDVKRRYTELNTDDDIADEVLARYSGRRGAERLRKEMADAIKSDSGITEKAAAVTAINKVRSSLNRFWRSVARMLGIRYTNAEDVADSVMMDIMNNRKPGLNPNWNQPKSRIDLISDNGIMRIPIANGSERQI